MATAETEHYKEDRTYIDCCVDWWYHFVNYQYAQKIGVSILVLIGVSVTVFCVSFQDARAPDDGGRRLRGETLIGPDTITARADIKIIYATLGSIGVLGSMYSYFCMMFPPQAKAAAGAMEAVAGTTACNRPRGAQKWSDNTHSLIGHRTCSPGAS